MDYTEQEIEKFKGDCTKCSHFRILWNGCTPDFNCNFSEKCKKGNMWEFKNPIRNSFYKKLGE